MNQKYKKLRFIVALGFGIVILAHANTNLKDLSKRNFMLEEGVNLAVKAIEPQAVECCWTPDEIANAMLMPTPLVLINLL